MENSIYRKQRHALITIRSIFRHHFYKWLIIVALNDYLQLFQINIHCTYRSRFLLPIVSAIITLKRKPISNILPQTTSCVHHSKLQNIRRPTFQPSHNVCPLPKVMHTTPKAIVYYVYYYIPICQTMCTSSSERHVREANPLL